MLRDDDEAFRSDLRDLQEDFADLLRGTVRPELATPLALSLARVRGGEGRSSDFDSAIDSRTE